MKTSITEKPKTDKRFLKWFANNLEATIYKPDGKNWVTNQHKISADRLWDLYKSDDGVVGVRPGRNTNYAMVDLDIGSRHHPENHAAGYELTLEALEGIGLTRTITVTSSHSGGLHVYAPLPKEFNSFNVAVTIQSQFALYGINVAPGQVEPFPNQKGYSKDIKNQTKYNGHRLPLQEGSFILDDDLNPFSDSAEVFCALMEEAAQYQDMELFESHIEASKELDLHGHKYKYSYESKDSTYTGTESPKATAWRLFLEGVIEQGWTGDSQTNKILQYLQTHGKVFIKKSGEALVDWMVATAQSMKGFGQWCGHIKDLRKRCKEWVECTESKGYYKPYRAVPDRLLEENSDMPKVNKNDLKAAEAQKRILDAIQDLGVYNYRTKTEFLTAIRNKSKQLFNKVVSNQTLYKHRSLWEGLIDIGDSAVKDDIQEFGLEDEIKDNSLDCETPCVLEVQNSTHHCIYEGILSQPQNQNKPLTPAQAFNTDHNHLQIWATKKKLEFEIDQKPLIHKGLQDSDVDLQFFDGTAFSSEGTEVSCFDQEQCDSDPWDAEEIDQEYPSDLEFHRGRERLVSPFM